ncbi:MAG: efflux RND transporter periplasmic adaptor subunit, partial [Eudoraea sp.]|uniref:efflux RND transporter periplasmic adaptor subunit n=2 Tax=Eudoraea sp. TaxID=1979955 RepID=UPI003C79217E
KINHTRELKISLMRCAPFSFRILFSLVLIFAFLGCNDGPEKILPSKVTITESVYSSVTIQPDSLYQVYAAVGGILDKIFVDEGDSVSKGTLIAQIINNTPKLNTQNAKLNLELARENYSGSNAIIRALIDELNAAELKYKNDSINFTRQKNLWDQNIGSKVEYENRKLAYELSGNNLVLLKGNFERTKSELKTKLKQAENNYQTSLIATEDFTVQSKINGKLYALFKNQGEIINTMEPIAAIGSAGDFIIEMLVDEVDIVKLKIGQTALITLDAYGSKVYSAIVNKIYPRKDERSQTFKIEAIFIDTPEVLYPGLAGEGNIIVSQKENALTIPKEYLIGENQVKTEMGIIEIVTGIQDMERIEVRSGLDAETYLLKPE